MSVFADSSAIVKLYASETGSAEIRALEELVVSQLAHVEVVSALWRKRRTGGFSARSARTLTGRFMDDLEDVFAIVRLNRPILDAAARLVPAHALHAGDAIQLASGLAARAADPTCTRFACFDERLREAAAAEGFTVLP